ncbi:BURP domain-containing protein BNM2A-like [Arachis stenosperma]|uniref:BURP domain-containing protein BNM2A-like n=1 Tax=Arachis stenosperma TaxID=217475 RepID=UPI0025AC52C1|nr:BURP domain-containing protein BNM2A-like [Arachis stenosperma]
MHSSSRNMAENFLILLLHLLVIMVYCSSHGREMGGGTKNNMNHHMMNNHHDIDPSLMVFLTMKDLKVGQRMPIYFPKRDPSTSPKLWPKQEADSVPFSLEKLPQLLQLFGFARDSAQAKAMEDTLRECESKPIKGEVKFCATSLDSAVTDSMLDFAQSILGKDSGFRVLSTSHKTKSSVSFQNYTMLEDIKEMEAPKMVACHTMPYPYGVFYCHSQTTQNKVYSVPLEGENGDKVEAIVVCHLDTSQWGSSHPSFQVLAVKPGTTSVCHFFPADNLIFVPKVEIEGFDILRDGV